ncbi:MAG: GTPase HflX [Bacilli bacterium]|nr:GTPase HflX [Bacilli bacterium]
MKKAIIVCASNNIEEANKSLDELNALLETLDISECARLTQKLDKFNNKTYIGQGKLEELKMMEAVYEPDYIVFDDELSPAQMFNLDSYLSSSVLDRAYVILDIFRARAQTPEARLEIKLANLRYLLPRIQTFHEGFDRQGGGIGSKGSGETQLELDRRALQNQILQTERKLDEVIKRKKNDIKKRENNLMKTVSLVGYTNAGKSTTMNTLLSYLNKYEQKNNLKEKSVEAEDKLFKTLSTSVRRLTYKNMPFLLSDTIGFINKIPAELISSFLTTLEEAKSADLIIIVLDASSPNINQEFSTTIETLNYLNINTNDVLILFNKVDKLEAFNEHPNIPGFDTLTYSNMDEKYQERLLEYIYNYLLKDYLLLDLRVPYSDQKIVSLIENNTNIISKTYMDTYIQYKIYCKNTYFNQLSLYRIDDQIM